MANLIELNCIHRSDYDALQHISDERRRVYASLVRGLDRGVGTVLRALKETGLEKRTLVIFTSDNGAPNYIEINVTNIDIKLNFNLI